MKSPLTGREMIQMSELDTLEYKGKVYDVIHHFYVNKPMKNSPQLN
jgi:hypothetical protein